MLSRLTLIALCIALAPVAQSAIYKCKQPDGRTAFQQQPCADASAQETVTLRGEVEPRRPIRARSYTLDGEVHYRDGFALVRDGSDKVEVFLTSQPISEALRTALIDRQWPKVGPHIGLYLNRDGGLAGHAPGPCELEALSINVWSPQRSKADFASGRSVLDNVALCSIEAARPAPLLRFRLRHADQFEVDVEGTFTLFRVP